MKSEDKNKQSVFNFKHFACFFYKMFCSRRYVTRMVRRAAVEGATTRIGRSEIWLVGHRSTGVEILLDALRVVFEEFKHTYPLGRLHD